ncbi:hypothetical protein B0T14DRAFT_492881 [Immersiella caudata]|uniref:Uncharacterized protein n=1 Tax=Immersiella caudata TaxID=314043 RepID=A0AA39X3G4_9PEZI|nr:hypothetical protein B0T14DRAFT_492881 [Immersiella caudata]
MGRSNGKNHRNNGNNGQHGSNGHSNGGNRGGGNGGSKGRNHERNHGSSSDGSKINGRDTNGRRNGSNNRRDQQNEREKKGNAWEPRLLEDIDQGGRYFATKLHQTLVIEADLMATNHKKKEAERSGWMQQGLGTSVWDIVDDQVDKGMCPFLHVTGIKDRDGDVLMSDPVVCGCIYSTGESGPGKLPACFLRAFYYLLAANKYRKGRPLTAGQLKEKEQHQAQLAAEDPTTKTTDFGFF